MDFRDVVRLVIGERQYQDDRRPRPFTDENTPIANWLLYIESRLNVAKTSVYLLDEKAALEEIRKITALGFACMQYNETPAREGYKYLGVICTCTQDCTIDCDGSKCGCKSTEHKIEVSE